LHKKKLFFRKVASESVKQRIFKHNWMWKCKRFISDFPKMWLWSKKYYDRKKEEKFSNDTYSL